MKHPSTLIIGDIHHRTARVDAVIRRHAKNFERIVFLGDYFDDFGDTPELMRETCRWLTDSLIMPNRIHLLGNHDLAYFFPRHRQCDCPGHTDEKQRVFDEEMQGVGPSNFRAAFNVGTWLLSHAGVTQSYSQQLTTTQVVAKAHDDLLRVQGGHTNEILNIGAARGGNDAVGGLFWLDWNREFRPVSGLNQIVGHTPAHGVLRGKALTASGTHRQLEIHEPSPFPRMKELPQAGAEWTSVNWCIDTHLEVLGSIRNNAFDLVLP